MNTLFEGLLTGWAIAIPLGAVGTVLVLHSARSGLVPATSAASGVATVDGGYALIAALGSTTFRDRLETLKPVLSPLAAALLLSIALTILVRSVRSADESSLHKRVLTGRQSYVAFVAMTAVNPLTLAYFASIVTGMDGMGTVRQVAPFSAGALVGSFTGHLIWVSCGLVLRPVVVSRRGRVTASAAGAAMVAMMAMRMLR